MSAIYFAVYIFLADLYASNFEITLAEIGIIFLIVRMFDAFSDPFIGVLSDTYKSRLGLRRLWIMLGTPIVIISVISLFFPEPSASIGFLHLFFWLSMLTIGWTLILNPYFALGAEISKDYHERSRITFYRETFSLIGTIFAAILYSVAKENTVGIGYIGLFVLLSLPVSVLLCVYFVKENIELKLVPNKLSPLRVLVALRSEPMFLKLLIAYFINGAANGLPAALFVFFVNQRINTPHLVGPLLLLYFGAAVTMMPLWLNLSKKIPKHKLWCYAMIYASTVFLCTIFVGSGDLYLFIAICFFSGAALSVDLAIPSSIQADLVDLETLNGGKQRTSTFFSLWSIATKGAIAISSGLSFMVLSYVDFNVIGSNTETALWTLTGLYAVVPIILKLVAIKLMWNFRFDRAYHAAVQRELKKYSDA